MFQRLRRTLLASVLFILTSLLPASAVTTFADIQYWIGPAAGPGINEAALVIDWRDGQSPLVWGYRWEAAESRTGQQMIAAIIGADARLTAQGVASNFVSNLGFDANLSAPAERFRPGYNASTGEYWGYFVNNDVFSNPADFSQNSHILPGNTTVVPLGSPYDDAGPGRWVSSNTGIAQRPLVNGSWDGYVYAAFGDLGPSPIPEPGSMLLLNLAALIALRRRRA